MFRALLKLVLVVVILAAAAAFFLGYRLGDGHLAPPASAQAPAIDTQKARETGAAIGEKVATGAARAEQVMNEGALSAKIKAKMALDDTVRARTINVDTSGTVVTLSGTVNSATERAVAVRLARDTTGVTSVVDHLVLR